MMTTATDRFSEEDDDNQIIEELFKTIDKDSSNDICAKEWMAALQKEAFTEEETELLTMLDEKLKTVRHKDEVSPAKEYVPNNQNEKSGFIHSYKPDQRDNKISLKEFEDTVKLLPRAKGQRVQWARSLNLHEQLARLLKKGNLFDGLKGLKDLKESEVDEHIQEVCAEFMEILPIILRKGLFELRNRKKLSAREYKNTKFCMDKAHTGSFAKLEDFYEGPEKFIGTPNPKIWDSIMREHCTRPNSSKTYRSPNYNFDFCPSQEYEFVTDPKPGTTYPHMNHRDGWTEVEKAQWLGERGREQVKLEEVMKRPEVEQAELKVGEVAALRLYTGPMYMLYNAVMRKSPEHVFNDLDGNHYETTIFCIVSGISKLSRKTALPPDRRVYRGLGGMILPETFWKATDGGFRGGIEWGFMSTTRSRQVAVSYSGQDKKRGTVLEIAVGRVDIGADLRWVSQYPGEDEVLFPPLTCLEVVGEPRVEDDVVIFPLHANMNLKGLTMEQLEQRRKRLHLSMAHNLREELVVQTTTGQTKVVGVGDCVRGRTCIKIRKALLSLWWCGHGWYVRICTPPYAEPIELPRNFQRYYLRSSDFRFLA